MPIRKKEKFSDNSWEFRSFLTRRGNWKELGGLLLRQDSFFIRLFFLMTKGLYDLKI
jgi:hypothetical protein